MFSSVRIRLTLWYTAAMAAILLVLACVTYFITSPKCSERGDAQAVELADTFLSTVNAEMGESAKADRLDDGVAAAIAEHRFRDVTFAVFDPARERHRDFRRLPLTSVHRRMESRRGLCKSLRSNLD